MSRTAAGAADGVVARGKIKVDARRAVEKLREHLLVDLHLYTLEIARAAVIGGASRIDVEHDADEVKISFDGEGLDEGTLTRLLDHVLVEAQTKDARRKRLLATGVNAALGLSPAYVDIYTPTEGTAGDPKGRGCLRVRWTPELLKPGDEDSPAKAPKCERLPLPAGMHATGVRIEVRRRVGWGVVRQAIAGGIAAEISLLASATHAIPVPMTLKGEPFPRPARAHALVRASMSVRGASRASVEIVAPLKGHPEIELLEQGVCLTRYAWTFGEKFPSTGLGNVTLPARVIVDADELPTNASRSEIQRDTPLIPLVTQAAHHAFEDALTTLIATVTGKGEAAPGTEILTKNKDALEDALGALACIATKAAREGAALPPIAETVLNVPLLADGLGRPLSPAGLLDRKSARVLAWRGKEPLPAELEPWMGDVVWIRGRVAERIYDLFDVADAQQIIEQAKVGAARRKALLAHAAAEPVVPPLEDELFRWSFEEKEDGEFKGLRGQVVAVAESAERPSTIVRVFVDGRQLDTIDIDAETIPLRLEIALSWEKRIRARYAYDGVERTSTLDRAIWYAVREAVFAADRLMQRRAKRPVEPPLRAALRAAIATHLFSADKLRVSVPAGQKDLSYLRGLKSAPIWLTTEPNRFESLNQLEDVIAKMGAICVARADAEGRAVDGRPVILGKPRELAWLAAALPPKTTFVQYTAWLVSPRDIELREAHRSITLRSTLMDSRADQATIIEIRRPGIRGFAAASVEPELIILHAGKRVLAPSISPALGPIAVVVDDDSVMPGEGLFAPKPLAIMDALGEIEQRLCESIVAAQEDATARAPAGTAVQPGAVWMSPIVRSYLLIAARELRARIDKAPKPSDEALLNRIRALPLLVTLDEMGAPIAASLADIERGRGPRDPIPYLGRPPAFETLNWRPVLIAREDPVFSAFERWAGARATPGEAEISARAGKAVLEAKKRAILAKPKLDLTLVGDLAERGARMALLSYKTHPLPGGVVIAAALPNTKIATTPGGDASMAIDGTTLANPILDVLFDGRWLYRHTLPALRIPLVARLSVSDESHLEGWERLSGRGLQAASQAVYAAATALADELIKAASGPANGGALFNDLRALRLLLGIFEAAVPGADIAEKLRAPAMSWPTVQGGWVPFDEMRVITGPAGPELCFGVVRHSHWVGPTRGRSDLDSPILHLPQTPEGAVLVRILEAMGVRRRSVTEALEKLQSRRSAARPGEAPSLSGAPAHPELRMSLVEGRVAGAEGELEIIEGPTSDVRVIGLDGTSVAITEEFPFPLRVIARVESVDIRPETTKALMKEIWRAALRRALSLGERLEEMPLFLRDHIRRVVCKSVSTRQKIAARQRKAPVFLSIDCEWRSLDDLQLESGAQVLYTTDPPPYPARRADEPIVRLSKEEADALALLGKTKDMSATLRRDRAAEARASVTPVSSILIDAELRSKCIRVIPINWHGVTGEVGILAPEHRSKRGINLFVKHRPLCLLDDRAGWALCAAVNRDSVKPNRWFDGVKSSGEADEIRRIVREAAEKEMRSWLAPPADALAVKWLDDGIQAAGEEKPLPAFGALWLPATWPVDPKVNLLGTEPSQRALIAPGTASIIRRHIPVCGAFFLAPELPWAAFERAALREAEIMIAALEPTPETQPAVEAYRWNIGLLGLTSVRVKPVRSADGVEINLSDVLGEFAGKGCIWVTRRDGSAEGAFPGSPPAFVLLDDGSPLIQVLRNRASRSAVRELGEIEGIQRLAPEAHPHRAPGAQSSSIPDVMFSPEIMRPPYSSEIMRPLYSPELSARSSGEPGGPEAPQAAALPWLERLRRRVALFFASGPANPDARLLEQKNALCASLHQALGELGLVGGPVHEIREVKRGPAVRYDAENQCVLLNRRSPALRWLHTSDAPSARALTFLIAAIVSEINRAMTGVTDAEERRVLLQLLRAGLDAPVEKGQEGA